jgi:hypothetical protein
MDSKITLNHCNRILIVATLGRQPISRPRAQGFLKFRAELPHDPRSRCEISALQQTTTRVRLLRGERYRLSESAGKWH